jgi:hypothetical protein
MRDLRGAGRIVAMPFRLLHMLRQQEHAFFPDYFAVFQHSVPFSVRPVKVPAADGRTFAFVLTGNVLYL